MTWRKIICPCGCSSENQTVVTTPCDHVNTREEGAAVIQYGAVPLELIESLHTQVFTQSLGEVQHLHRQQSFLQLSAWTTQSCYVQGVDGVDPVLDKNALTPADHLATQPDVTGVITYGIVVIDKSIKELNTCAFLQRVTTG